MEQLMRRILLAAFLGVLVGVAVGYTPWVQPANAPRALIMQRTPELNTPFSPVQPSEAPTQLLLALLAGLIIAVPLFLVLKRRNQS